MATLIVPENPSPEADAEAIRKAVKGFGTDEKEIISIIGHRNAFQRKLIKQAYQEIHHEDLIRRFEKELNGDFEKAVYRWMLEPEDRDAVLAHIAMKHSPPDYRTIVELSCIYSPDELLAVKRAYQSRYKLSIEEDLATHVHGDLGKAYDGAEINGRLAQSEATVLRDVIKDKAFNHEEVVRIVSTRSKAQLMATFNRCKDDHGTSITKHLRDDSENFYLAAVRTAIKCIDDPQKYYEKVLRNALQKHRKDEDALTRVIVTRAEKDLKEITELYYKRNSVSLDHTVSKETSGDYKAFLLTLLGKEH